ncbi:hypothetical protein RKE29_13740 [Streptomyces sp. B1866]|nr:hypothetical protein [Streptomyces sp. B1866]
MWEVTGSGQDNAPLTNKEITDGIKKLDADTAERTLDVTIKHQPDPNAEEWPDSDTYLTSSTMGLLKTRAILSEDMAGHPDCDNDLNDAVVLVSWWEPPQE